MTGILLLNASYEPLAVITYRRALALWLKGRVEGVTPDSVELTGVASTLQIPTIIRLRRYINVPRRQARWSKRAVLQRDRFTCAYCGVRPGDLQRGQTLNRQSFTIDHILPVSRGGKNSWGNTVCACAPCNQRKGNRTPHEANMRLLWEPKTPRVNYVVASGEAPTTWKIYLEI